MVLYTPEMAPARADVNAWRAYVDLPENADRNFELINGELVEKMPGTTFNSTVGIDLSFFIKSHCLQRNLPCYISSGDGAYEILGNVVAPDLAYKPTPTSKTYPDLDPPLLVVEIISPNDKAADIRDKRQIYLEAGILYWELYPERQSVDVYAPGQPMRTVGMDGVLDGGGVLPGFSLPAAELWRA